MMTYAANLDSNGALNLTPNITGPSEDSIRALVVRATSGDVTAYEDLVRAYRNLVCSIAVSILKDVEASEEVAQEVFVTVWQRLNKLRNPASFLPWLRQITRAYAIDSVRRRIRGRNYAHRAMISQSVCADPRDKLIRAEEIAAMRKALELLPNDTREIFTLYYREDQSVRQVAALLDLSESTVKQRLARGRSRLREELETSFAKTIRETTPGAAFATGVMGAIALAAPAAGFAAGVGAVEIGKGAGMATKATAGLSAGVLAGFTLGACGIFYGMRRIADQAIDSRERRGLHLITVFKLCAVLALFACIGSGYDFKSNPTATFGLILSYWTIMFTTSTYGISRVTRRRRDLMKLEDPEKWKKDQRQLRRGALISVGALILILIWAALWMNGYSAWPFHNY